MLKLSLGFPDGFIKVSVDAQLPRQQMFLKHGLRMNRPAATVSSEKLHVRFQRLARCLQQPSRCRVPDMLVLQKVPL